MGRVFNCRGFVGRWSKTRRIYRKDEAWEFAEYLADETADTHKDHMDSPPVMPVYLVKASIQLCNGAIYFLTFRTTGVDGVTTGTYNAKVWFHPAGFRINTLSFEKAIPSNPTPGNSKKGKKKIRTPGLVCRDKSGKLRCHAFYLLLAQIRSEKPSLKYTMAKKAASRKWRSLSEDEMKQLKGYRKNSTS